MSDEQTVPLVRVRNVVNGGYANVDEDLADALYPDWERADSDAAPRRRGRPRKPAADESVSGDAADASGSDRTN